MILGETNMDIGETAAKHIAQAHFVPFGISMSGHFTYNNAIAAGHSIRPGTSHEKLPLPVSISVA
jgi:hypothetical protein